MSEIRSPGCEAARRSIHRRLDGDRLDGAEERSLLGHRAGCAACREAELELRAVQNALRALPPDRLPDAALRAVLDRTVRAEREGARPRLGLDWRLAAAAAVTIAVIGLWYAVYPPPPRPREAELTRAALETRMVLRLTAQALHKAERTAMRDVLAPEVSGALRRLPIEWPSHSVPSEGGRPTL